MNIPYALLLIGPTFVLLLVIVFAAPRRLRMERRARALLAQYPDAERTSVYLPLHSTFGSGKQREIDSKIAEMQPWDWTFLRAMEASPLRTMSSCGGGLTLHFVRVKV